MDKLPTGPPIVPPIVVPKSCLVSQLSYSCPKIVSKLSSCKQTSGSQNFRSSHLYAGPQFSKRASLKSLQTNPWSLASYLRISRAPTTMLFQRPGLYSSNCTQPNCYVPDRHPHTAGRWSPCDLISIHVLAQIQTSFHLHGFK